MNSTARTDLRVGFWPARQFHFIKKIFSKPLDIYHKILYNKIVPRGTITEEGHLIKNQKEHNMMKISEQTFEEMLTAARDAALAYTPTPWFETEEEYEDWAGDVFMELLMAALEVINVEVDEVNEDNPSKYSASKRFYQTLEFPHK